MNSRRLGAPLVGVAVATTTLLAGCGGASSSPASSASSAGAPSSAATATPQQLGSVAIIGDSLTYQDGRGEKAMTAQLVAAGWPASKICWSGSDGRTIVGTLPGGAPSSQAEVKRCRAKLGEPSLWIIPLMSNNLGDPPASVRKDMATLFATLGPEAKVLWVNTARNDLSTPNLLRLNPVVKQVVEARPNTRLADWYGYLATHKKQAGWWQADGGHMTPVGYAQRNAFIAQQAKAYALAG